MFELHTANPNPCVSDQQYAIILGDLLDFFFILNKQAAVLSNNNPLHCLTNDSGQILLDYITLAHKEQDISLVKLEETKNEAKWEQIKIRFNRWLKNTLNTQLLKYVKIKTVSSTGHII